MAEASLPIDNRVLVALTNKFLTESVRLLNNVCVTAEEKMMKIHQKIKRIEDGIAILDGKLDSVPGIAQSVAGLGQPTPPAGPGISPDPPAQNVSQTDNPKPTSQEPEIVAVVESAPVEKVKTLCEDERYSKYFKMLKMGVPLQAVKNKMAVEGLDVAVLDHPDQPVPGGEDRAETVSSAGEESDRWE